MLRSFTPNPDGTPGLGLPRLQPRIDVRPDIAEINRFWWKRPATVRILMYKDSHTFEGGSFSLEHVVNAINSDPWPWANFDVTRAHRFSDPTADVDNVSLTDIDLDDFDEVWLFGFSGSANMLSAAEVTALEEFMDDGGGVLTTGDHGQLGRGLSGQAKRISKLRAYPAPAAAHPVWNTTIRDANMDGAFTFGEQSDSTPQTIRVRYWYGWGGIGGFGIQKFPHPVLCAEQGVLRKLPDHQHEGQVTIPNSFPVSEWPKVGSVQPKPEVIAWGRIVDPGADNAGGEFPVIGAYDGHKADVGRIVADSTWHHWFDINLDGFNVASQDYRDIASYFQNVAAWLAPAHKQRDMRNGVFWLTLQHAALQEIDLLKAPTVFAIKTARDALGQWAPQCLVHAWLLPLLPVTLQAELVTTDPRGPKLRHPVEDAILVEALGGLQQHFKIQSGVVRPAESFDEVDAIVARAAPAAVEGLMKECRQDMEALEGIFAKIAPVVDVSSNGTSRRSTRRQPAASG